MVMLHIVDASSRAAKKRPKEGYVVLETPLDSYISLEGESELLIQLIRDEKVSLKELQDGTLYVYSITDRNRSSLGYFGSVLFLR